MTMHVYPTCALVAWGLIDGTKANNIAVEWHVCSVCNNVGRHFDL